MDTIIKDRLSTIISLVLGSAGGWGFTEILTAPELKAWLITISIAVSFLLSLIISLSLMGKMTVAKRRAVKKKGWYLLIGFVLVIAAFYLLYSNYTIKIPWASPTGQIGDTVIVKGLTYTQRAKIYRDSLKKIDQFRNYPGDDVLLEDATYEINQIWSDSSRTYARLMLLFSYTIMICIFIGGVTLVAEGMMHSQRKSGE